MANTTLTVTGTNCAVTGGTVAKSTNGTSTTGARSADFLTSGKFYFEFTPNTIAGTAPQVGLCNANISLTTAGSASSVAWVKGGGVSAGGSSVGTAAAWVAATVNGIAVDYGLRKIWFRVGAAGNWNNVAGANPATGLGGFSLSDAGGFLAAFCQLNATNDQITFNFGGSAFTGAVPAGFTSGLPTNTAGTAFLDTQSGIEVVVADTPAFRITQLGLEVVVTVAAATPVNLAGRVTTQLTARPRLAAAALLAGRVATQLKARPRLTAAALLAGRVSTQLKARAGLTTAVYLAGRATTQLKARLALTTTVHLTGRVMTQVAARAALTSAVLLAGRVTTQLKARATMTSAVLMTGLVTTKVAANALLSFAATTVELVGTVTTQLKAAAQYFTGFVNLEGQVTTQISANAELQKQEFDVTQLGVEVVVEDQPSLEITQVGIEAVVVDPSTLYVSQSGVEVVVEDPSAFYVSQLGLEVVVTVAGANTVPLTGTVKTTLAVRSELLFNVNLTGRVTTQLKVAGDMTGGDEREVFTGTIQMVDPRYETPRSWTAKNTPALLAYGAIPILFDDDNWRAWATTVISLPAFTAINAPRPEHFDDWRQWAWRFNESAMLLPAIAVP